MNYAYSVDEPEYIETGATDTNIEYGLSIDEEDNDNKEQDKEKTNEILTDENETYFKMLNKYIF